MEYRQRYQQHSLCMMKTHEITCLQMFMIMRKGSVDIVKVYFGSAVPILAAAAFYFVPSELLISYIIACAVHELGHLAALKIFRVVIFSFSVELRGLVIEHGEIENPFIRLICLLAGPVAGLLFAFFCSALSEKTNMQWLDICAALSLILSIFNLMPCVLVTDSK